MFYNFYPEAVSSDKQHNTSVFYWSMWLRHQPSLQRFSWFFSVYAAECW